MSDGQRQQQTIMCSQCVFNLQKWRFGCFFFFLDCHHLRPEIYRGHADCTDRVHERTGFITERVIWECFLSEGREHCECELVFDALGGRTSWGSEHMTAFLRWKICGDKREKKKRTEYLSHFQGNDLFFGCFVCEPAIKHESFVIGKEEKVRYCANQALNECYSALICLYIMFGPFTWLFSLQSSRREVRESLRYSQNLLLCCQMELCNALHLKFSYIWIVWRTRAEILFANAPCLVYKLLNASQSLVTHSC